MSSQRLLSVTFSWRYWKREIVWNCPPAIFAHNLFEFSLAVWVDMYVSLRFLISCICVSLCTSSPGWRARVRPWPCSRYETSEGIRTVWTARPRVSGRRGGSGPPQWRGSDWVVPLHLTFGSCGSVIVGAVRGFTYGEKRRAWRSSYKHSRLRSLMQAKLWLLQLLRKQGEVEGPRSETSRWHIDKDLVIFKSNYPVWVNMLGDIPSTEWRRTIWQRT